MNEIAVKIQDGENGFVCFYPNMDLRSAVCRLVIPYLPPEQVEEHMDDFLSVGLTADEVAEVLWSWQIKNNIPKLLASGVKPQDIIEKLGHDEERLEKYFDLLLDYGASINEILIRIGDDSMWYRNINIEDLLAKGADPNIIARYAIDGRYYDSSVLMKTLLEHGADCNCIIATVLNRRQGYLLIDNYRLLSKYGKFDLETLIYEGHIDYKDVLMNLEELSLFGIKINAKKFAKMVARRKGCKYSYILAECGLNRR